MKITETRKAIIELIEPYMDKTLNEGCMIKSIYSCITKNDLFKLYDRKYNNGERGHIYFKYMGTDGNLIKDWEELNKDNIGLVIIGHYDITAVDSFIIGIGEELTYMVIVAGTQSKAVLDKNDKFIGNYSNKPLHLYTEEEDKNLLELLKKIGQK